ncbi:trehalose-phosphatase [Ilumatobacter sp.]|uniref:trehalose-phosphatase n=1 Tax=Ilumatobacter sp. TaxID=1967498 RepID=UPI003752EB9D
MTLTPEYHDPTQLGSKVAGYELPLLIGLDIDGVLSPLVDHADDARLLDGIADVLARLLAADDVSVAAVSGRAVSSMRTFGLPPAMRLVGSHGMEEDGRPFESLDDAERARLDQLIELADAAAVAGGDGAWVEHKQASVAVHIREADETLGTAALSALAIATQGINGTSTKAGSNVLELFTRHASKGSAVERLRTESGSRTAMFVGDDLTDEEAFAALGEADVSIKVGPAPTMAQFRLAAPEDVLEFLRALANCLCEPA